MEVSENIWNNTETTITLFHAALPAICSKDYSYPAHSDRTRSECERWGRGCAGEGDRAAIEAQPGLILAQVFLDQIFAL